MDFGAGGSDETEMHVACQRGRMADVCKVKWLEASHFGRALMTKDPLGLT